MDLIKKQGGKVVGGQLVTDVTVDSAAGAVSGVYTSTRDGKKTYYAADAVIFAVGITGESPPVSVLCAGFRIVCSVA